MRFEPRPYQRKIIDFIAGHPRSMVWAGMGMGKTVSTLTALEGFRFLGDTPALVVAPLRVAQSTWPDEVLKWDHLKDLRMSVICGDAKRRRAALEKDADVYCTNFEQLPWLVETLGTKWPFRVVVVDEATRLKGFRLRQGTQRAKALAKVAHNFCRRFIELTGTPSANGLLDLWGQAWFIDRGDRLGKSMGEYQAHYFRPLRLGDEAYMVKWIPMPGSDARIKDKLSDVALTINPEDWFDIKQPITNRLTVTLPDSAMEAYRKLERDLYAQLEGGDIEAVNAQSVLGKCLQLASGAVYREDGSWLQVHDAKVKALESVVEEAAGAPVLVAYQFRHEIERIKKALPQAVLLDKDPNVIRRWNRGEIPLLLAHPAACGHGLNLQDGGNILCFFSTGWNYEQYAQMCERIGPTRQAQSGHPRPVFIHHIVAKGTVDEAVLSALSRKEDVLNFLLGKGHERD